MKRRTAKPLPREPATRAALGAICVVALLVAVRSFRRMEGPPWRCDKLADNPQDNSPRHSELSAVVGRCGHLPSCAGLPEEEVTWHRSWPRYSTFTCMKGRFGRNWRKATCKFHNVCLNATTLRFQYYVDAKLPDAPLLYTPQGSPLYEFPADMVDAEELSCSGSGVYMDGCHGFEAADLDYSFPVPWKPDVVRSLFPQRGERVKMAPAPQALLTALYALPAELTTDFKHAMYDIAVPLFNMQHLFGVYTPTAQPLLLPGGESTAHQERKLHGLLPLLVNNATPGASPLPLHWNHYLASAEEYVQQVLGGRGDGLVCFRTVLVGTGPLSRRVAQTDARPYRDAAMCRMGLKDKPQTRPVVTILHTERKPTVENSVAVQAALQQRYGDHVTVGLVDCGREIKMTDEQVNLVSGTSVLITPPGETAAFLNFLPDCATAITLSVWNTNTNRSESPDDLFYRQMEYPTIEVFPVTLQDYQHTTDRPACEVVSGRGELSDLRLAASGRLLNCNVHLQPESIQRLVHHVDAALLRWAEYTGRHDTLQPLLGPLLQRERQQQRKTAALAL